MRQNLNPEGSLVDLRKAFLSRRRTSKDGENFVRIDVGEGEGGEGRRGQEGAGKPVPWRRKCI